MTQSLVLSIDVCRELALSPLRTKHPPEFFLSRSWPKIVPGFFFGVFQKFGTLVLINRAHRELYLKFSGGYLVEFNFLMETLRFRWHGSDEIGFF